MFLVGGLLSLPSISRRLVFDDHLQAILRMPKPPIEGLVHTSVDLFTFGKPGPINDTFIERGIIVPWWVFRSERYPLKLGEKVELSDMSITITELRPKGNPAAAVFAFREPLESSRYQWLAWDQHGCHPFSPPRMGETTTLPGVDFAKLLQEMWRARYGL